MATNIFKTVIIVGLGVLLQACPTVNLPCEGVDDNKYIISNPGLITVYPEQTIFNIGDTIWVESNIASQQTTNTGQSVDIRNELGVDELSFQGFLFAIKDSSTDTNPSPAAPMVKILAGKAQVINSNGISSHQLTYLWYDSINKYKLELGYIMEEKGHFSLYDPDLDRMRVVASIGNGCGETYSIYTTLANPNNGYAFEFEVSD